MEPAIIIQSVVKRYGKVEALKGITVEIQRGEIFGFIGPDGAGKTSLFRILTSLIVPDEGKVTVDGSDVVSDYKDIRRKVGYMPGRFSLYQDLTVEENLRFFAGVFKTTPEENYRLIEDIYRQIEPFKDRRAGKLSGGMKQKLALSCALVHKPEVLFLDEPTTGVDVVSRSEFWQMLQKLKRQGITIVVSTPYMDEAAMCDRVALINKGLLLRVAPPETITASFNKPLFSVRGGNRYRLASLLRNFQGTDSTYWFGDSIRWIPLAESSPAALQKYLSDHNCGDVEVVPVKPHIEDCFMDLMGEA